MCGVSWYFSLWMEGIKGLGQNGECLGEDLVCDLRGLIWEWEEPDLWREIQELVAGNPERYEQVEWYWCDIPPLRRGKHPGFVDVHDQK